MLGSVSTLKKFLLIGFALVMLVTGVLVLDRLLFLRRAVRADGEVTRIVSANATCSRGSGKRSKRYPCTKYQAVVKFPTAGGESYGLTLSSGSTRGHDQGHEHSLHRPGQVVRVVYDPKNPGEAYPDTFFGVWGDVVAGLTGSGILLAVFGYRRDQQDLS